MVVGFSPTVIPFGAGLVSVPSYQSQGWTISTSTHLEGKCYAHTKAWAGTTIVTGAHIDEPGVSDQLNAWLAIIRNVITEKHVHLPETSHLFLEIHADIGSCNYYFVDHSIRTVFWLHTLDTISIGPQRSFSSGHLHTPILEPPAFPLTDECERLIETLERSKDHASSTLITTYVASSWATVASHRSLVYSDSKRSPVLTTISNVLLFGFPEEHMSRFENLGVDQLANTSRWREHVSETADDLKQQVPRMLALLSANILMLQISSLPALTKFSLILCVLSLTMMSTLLQEQWRLVGTSATTAVYLGGLVTLYGFQPIAIVHSLSQALFVWALLLRCATRSICGLVEGPPPMPDIFKDVTNVIISLIPDLPMNKQKTISSWTNPVKWMRHYLLQLTELEV
ncbi:hypothetical protein EDB92DRAFT_2104876 [Lactarius akahatsu]|uniref:Uncharacterized protein n=1 Tax=Lactarius akahatsu TaxID=416441 RepID=A0AAD4LBM1_9AGAM|nr:hypothetical protein EDB92DRAFT_2104876 [Lactarius akahatsu]